MSNIPLYDQPILSVVIPAFNAEATIGRCIRSIQANCDVALEIIVVNDGSIDRTGSICDTIAKEDPRIHVIHKRNEGVGKARNTGMEAARGSYLAFVDADDMVAETMYIQLINQAEQVSADIVVCNIENVFTDHSEQESHVFGDQVIDGNQQIHERIVVPLIVPGHPDAQLLQSGCNKLYKTQLVRKYHLAFTSLPWAEDWMFNIEYFMKAVRVAFISQSLYRYDRTTPVSLSKTWHPDSFDNTVWIQNKLAELFPERYTQEQLLTGVLGIQRERLYSYVNFQGFHGFWNYAATLFHNETLRNAYQELERIPRRYRFAGISITHDWELGYCIWASFTVPSAFLKFVLRPWYQKVKRLLREAVAAPESLKK